MAKYCSPVIVPQAWLVEHSITHLNKKVFGFLEIKHSHAPPLTHSARQQLFLKPKSA